MLGPTEDVQGSERILQDIVRVDTMSLEVYITTQRVHNTKGES